MKKMLIFILILCLTGCKTDDNQDVDYIEEESLKTIVTTYYSGTYYTSVGYKYVMEDYTYTYSLSIRIFSVYLDDVTYSYKLEEDEWVLIIPEDIPEDERYINLSVFRTINLDWFEPYDVDEENSSLFEYDLRLKEEYIDELFELIYNRDYDETFIENSWGSYDCFLGVDENDNIVEVSYSSFPSHKIEYISIDEIYPLPDSIKLDLDLE